MIQRKRGSHAPASRFSLRGDFWTRSMLLAIRCLPDCVAVILVRPISLLFCLAAKQERASIIANFQALHPKASRWAQWCAAYSVFAQFAFTYLDRLWHMHYGRPVKWEIENGTKVETALRKSGGVLLFTVHSGNYDVAASLIYTTFGRPLHIVRKREQSEPLQKIRAAELEKSVGLQVHYNDDPWTLGVDLCGLLAAGEVVAVLADRAVPGLACARFEHAGLKLTIPEGPLVLAGIARVPCFPVFLTRVSACHYKAHFGESICDGARKHSAREIGGAWVPLLFDFLYEHFDQWFVFEEVLAQ